MDVILCKIVINFSRLLRPLHKFQNTLGKLELTYRSLIPEGRFIPGIWFANGFPSDLKRIHSQEPRTG
jgi:hypothetical protein